jgi:two-component system, chemotaxis family, sensor kinase CheA
MLKRLPIRLKLMLLAGVPVLGALILATWIARDARSQAASAASLGSIEDLARLSAHMSGLVHELQFERNDLSLRMAQKTLDSPELKARFASTDAARDQLDGFMRTRNVANLPPRLARDLKLAQAKLRAIHAEREAATSGKQALDELLAYYGATNLSLISATAALAQLTDDGQLMRAITALVTVLQIKERASQEHALLSHVFVLKEFPAGTYRDLVTLTTQEADYMEELSVNATDDITERFRDLLRAPEFTRTAELRKIAVDTMNDEFGVNPEEWSEAQGKKIARFRALEVGLNAEVTVAAQAKVTEAAAAVLLSYGLGGGIIVLSALLAGLIARGISRSLSSLSEAAERVRSEKNFSVRALKTTEDEFGALTDTFNEMLSGIEGRDAELRHHRENLEQLIEQRTAALSKRNLAMRLVLDNVEQGLATIELDGKLASERSRAFDDWFGGHMGDGSFAAQLASRDEEVRLGLQMGWEQVIDGFLPVATAIDQMPSHIQVAEQHYNLAYKPILDQEALLGALLVVSDVTKEMGRLRRDAEQREMLNVFERVMHDPDGFLEFVNECEALVALVVCGNVDDPRVLMRAIHTVKGNCSMFGVDSVAQVAHRLESALAETKESSSLASVAELLSTWTSFTARVRRLYQTEKEAVLEVTYDELETLEAAAAGGATHATLSELLARLKFERGSMRLRRVADQARGLAERLGKAGLEVRVNAGSGVRFQTERWAPFWIAFVHVLRNAIDHGIEAPDARAAAGKSGLGLLELSAHVDARELTIEVSDDGRGVDWERVRGKAAERGLPHSTAEELVAALFSDGLSTCDTVNETSGRGIGLSAVRDAVNALGGAIAVVSTLGSGCKFVFRFPLGATTSEPSRFVPRSTRQSLSSSAPSTADDVGKTSAA